MISIMALFIIIIIIVTIQSSSIHQHRGNHVIIRIDDIQCRICEIIEWYCTFRALVFGGLFSHNWHNICYRGVLQRLDKDAHIVLMFLYINIYTYTICATYMRSQRERRILIDKQNMCYIRKHECECVNVSMCE